MPEMSLAEVQEAAERIAKTVHRTPVFSSRRFNEAAGVTCFFKGENLQRADIAFRLRGAANFLLSMPPRTSGAGGVVDV